MSNDPIRRVLRWKRLEIGLTHDPLFGDKRHGRKMKAGYGHVRGSYGDAEDGMSLDVYVGPDLGSDHVFRVRQVIPESKDFDEYKYIIGTWSPDEAEKLFLDHMPSQFYGGVEPVPLSELEQYQKPLSKALGHDEISNLSLLWSMPAEERIDHVLSMKAIARFGPELPAIHRVLFEA